MKRIYESLLNEHHGQNRQMAFISGPRQVGKTTTCKKTFPDASYINWDNITDRTSIIKGPEEISRKIGLQQLQKTRVKVIFDEIHKFSKWKNFLKGFFDSYADKTTTTVTGSAKLQIYKRGGDSLTGRYFSYRMHPLSVAELARQAFTEKEVKPPVKISKNAFNNLLRFGGFPEPYIKSNVRFANRWKKSRMDQLLKEDIRDLTRISEIDQIQLLAYLIKLQAGQLVNYSNLAQASMVSINTIKSWISSLKKLYYCFEVKPWYRNISKSLIKQPKLYLWDWTNIDDLGAKYENFIASHLLKAVHWWTDIGLGDYQLHYLRDKLHREVDFIVTRNNNPWFVVEVKASRKQSLSGALFYFQQQTNAKHAFQVVFDADYIDKDCFSREKPVIVPVITFLSQLI